MFPSSYDGINLGLYLCGLKENIKIMEPQNPVLFELAAKGCGWRFVLDALNPKKSISSFFLFIFPDDCYLFCPIDHVLF